MPIIACVVDGSTAWVHWPALPTLVEPRLVILQSFRLAELMVIDLVSEILFFLIISLLKIIRKMKQRNKEENKKIRITFDSTTFRRLLLIV